MPQTQRQRSSSTPRFTAKTADKHVLYHRSVQAPEAEVEFLTDWVKKIRGRKPLSLREDFCGSALLCAHWVQSNKQRTATGLDIDGDVLKWGIKHNLAPLGPDQERINLLCQDVRGKVASKHDIVCAFNFSYWIFKTREALRDYFARVRSGLVKDGLFFLDAYGGWEAHEPMQEHRKIKGGFTYGRTDEFGWDVVDDPVHVHDLQATVLHALGIDHKKLVYRHQGRDFRLTDVGGSVIPALLA